MKKVDGYTIFHDDPSDLYGDEFDVFPTNITFGKQGILEQLHTLFISPPHIANPPFLANLYGYVDFIQKRNIPDAETRSVSVVRGVDEFVTRTSYYNRVRPVVIFHGNFNNIPHPGWIEVLAKTKAVFPGTATLVGVGGNLEISRIKTDDPFMTTQFRANMLAATGLVDGIFPVEYTSISNDDEDAYIDFARIRSGHDISPGQYLRNRRIYAGRVEYFSKIYNHPNVKAVIANGSEEVLRKTHLMGMYYVPNVIVDVSRWDRRFADFHSSSIYNQRYTPYYVTKCWEELGNLYFK